LPPELVGQIYDQIYAQLRTTWTPEGQQFLPIAHALLHYQRLNLYRRVTLHDRNLLFKFCNTIIASESKPQALGEMVKKLLVWGLDKSTEESAEKEMDQLLRSMLPHLIHLKSLFLRAPSIARSVLNSFTTTPPPSSLVSLDLKLDDPALIDLILPLFPSLQHLVVHVVASAVNKPTADRIPLHPPRRLKTLEIFSGYRDHATLDLIASTEATETILNGPHTHLGLACVRNSDVMTGLSVDWNNPWWDFDREAESLSHLLSKLSNLTKLTLHGVGRTHVGNHFFTDYFKSDLQLQSLCLCQRFELNTADLIHAFQTKPITLKSLVLDLDGRDEQDSENPWPGIGIEGIAAVIKVYSEGGVEVSGSVFELLRALHYDPEEGAGAEEEGEEEGEDDEESEGDSEEGSEEEFEDDESEDDQELSE
jgi:hypothetical protein